MSSPKFTISAGSIEKRQRNIFWGGVFSVLLVGIFTYGHYRHPETYNDVLFWSVVGCLVIGNLVNYYRHRRYLRLIQDHHVEIGDRKAQFWTGGKKTELDLRDIVALNVYKRHGVLQHIQVRLKTSRAIRLEGYQDLERMAELLGQHIPKTRVVEKHL